MDNNFLNWLNYPLDSDDLFPAIVRLNYNLNGKYNTLELTNTYYPYLYWWYQENTELINLPALIEAKRQIENLLNTQFRNLSCFNGNMPFLHKHYYFITLNPLPYDVLNNSDERNSFIAWLFTYGQRTNYHMSTDEKALLGKISPASKYLTYGSYILTLFHEHFSNFKDFSKVENTLRVSHDYYSSYTSHIAKFSKSEVELLATLPPLSYFKTNNHLEELMTIKQLPIAHDSKQNILHFLEYLGFQQENPQTPAPPIRSEKKVDFGVNIMGYPQSEMGLGEDARTTLRALQKNAIPVSALSIESKDHHHPKLISEINEFISDTQKYKINIINSPIATAAFEIYRNKSLSQFQEFYNIAYAPWELETWPHELQSCLKIYNEIWAPSRFIEKAFQNNFNIPVHYMPLAVTINPFEKRSRDYFGLPNDKYIYLSMFDFNSSLNRKNPYDSVRAFKMAFTKNEDVILAIKVMYSKESVEWNNFIQLIDNDPRIIIINKVLSRQDVLALFDVCDSFISLHRSEGFGRCLAEAMLLKKPVIATDYSGNVDFCTIEFSFPVDYQLIKVQPTEYVFVDGQNWAAPILESAVQQMREVFYNRKLTLQVTNNAYKNISENFSELACGKRYAQRVLEIKKDLCEYL